MKESRQNTIRLYSASWCGQAISVENFLTRNEVAFELIRIDGNNDAREELIQINGGYASVPTLIFPDGSKLTEPSFAEIRQKLDLDQETQLGARLREMFRRKDAD